MSIVCIRGATTVENNDKNEIIDASRDLFCDIMAENNISPSDIIMVMTTATRDLDKAYPAVAARQAGITDAALSCVQEMYVEGSIKKCIRATVIVECDKKQKELIHIYKNRAVGLRPDFDSRKKRLAIAIDGPAGSGKSTVARLVAKKLGIIYVDTGAMYRAVALYCKRKGVDTSNSEAVSSCIDDIDIDIVFDSGEQKIILNGDDVSAFIRTAEMGKGASDVGAVFDVRQKLIDIQRKLAEKYSVVMDGRDIGTNVIPDAKYKVYVTADVKERAKRRKAELNSDISFSEIEQQIIQRDKNDMERKHNPLRKADDAIEIDTTSMTIDDVVSRILDIVKE